MKLCMPVIALTLFIAFLSACGEPVQNPDNVSSGQINNGTNINDTTLPVIKSRSVLDSIEQKNNDMVVASGDDINRAVVYLSSGDSAIRLQAQMRMDHRFYGYALPDIASERLLLLSIFTDDVEGNPFGCRLGAYYSAPYEDVLDLQYRTTEGNFVKVNAIDSAGTNTILYFEKRWIAFE